MNFSLSFWFTCIILWPPRIPKSEIAKGLGSSRIDKGVWVDFPR